MILKNKIALVTGSSRGIVRSIVEEFSREGAKVILNYKSSEVEAKNVCLKIKENGNECMAIKADVSNADEVKDMVNKALEYFKRIDVLVNNAGIMITNTNNFEDLKKMISVNLYSMVYTIEALRENFMKNGGKIINIASIAGIVTSLEGTTFYSITKGGVITLTKRYAFELGKYGVNVNAISPGYIETDMTKKGKDKEDWERTVKLISEKTALRRIGKPLDIARVAVFLASKDSDFITGQVIVVDGGREDYFSHSL